MADDASIFHAPQRLRRAAGARIRVLVTSPHLSQPALQALAAGNAEYRLLPMDYPPNQLAQAIATLAPDAILSRTMPLRQAAIDASPALKVIAKHGVGIDNIDLGAATQRGIPVLVCAGGNARTVAEHALALILALARNLAWHDAGMRAGAWKRFERRGFELAGRTLGLVGFGASARSLARMAVGLDMPVVAYSPSLASKTLPPGVTAAADLRTLLAAADIVSLHCPLTAQTRGMIGRDAMAGMRPGAWLINVSRGPLVDEAALIEALHDGRIAAAGLDSYAVEPLAADSPLRSLENVVLTPHLAGGSQEAAIRVGLQAVSNLFAVLDGAPIPAASVANPAVFG